MSQHKTDSEISVARLGSQQKEILRYLYQNKTSLFKQVELIEQLCGEVTDSRKASFSRSISKLQEADIVKERKQVLITPEDSSLVGEPYWSSHRVRYGLTDGGVSFLESDSRFPEITGE